MICFGCLGELIEDRSVAAELYRRYAESYGVKGAQRMMGLKFRDPRIPALEDFLEFRSYAAAAEQASS